jgi:prepilin-type N-terminal cleavage/methylation domain-containing protein
MRPPVTDNPRPLDRPPLPQRRIARGGFSLLEFIVALLVLGIALAGLFPLVIACSRAVAKLEACNPETGRWQISSLGNQWVPSDPQGQHPNMWYLVPSTDEWARKLGLGASLVDASPGASAPPVLSIDDDNDTTDPAYANDPEWSDGTNDAYLGDSHYLTLTPGTAASKATWTFRNIPAGYYQVQATWPTVDQDNGARYDVFDGDHQLIASVQVNQRSPSQTPLAYGGRTWYVLQEIFARTTTGVATAVVQVELGSPDASGQLAADAVRLVGNTVAIQSLQKSSDGGAAAPAASATVSVAFPTP